MRRVGGLGVLLILATSAVVGQGQETFAEMEAAIVREHALARLDPERYVDLLRERGRYYRGRLLELPGEVPLSTAEGRKALDEAIEALRRTSPMAALQSSDGMSRGARDHVRDQGPAGSLGHDGSDGSKPWDRINRYGTWSGTTAENISYGPATAREVVLQLIVDDGVSDRGHRHNIFNPAFAFIGVACGPHREFSVMCVMTYAASYVEHPRFARKSP